MFQAITIKKYTIETIQIIVFFNKVFAIFRSTITNYIEDVNFKHELKNRDNFEVVYITIYWSLEIAQ